MEFGLEFMAIVRSNFFDEEGGIFDDVVDKIDCVDLSMLLVDFQGTNRYGIVNSSILKAPYLLAFFPMDTSKT